MLLCPRLPAKMLSYSILVGSVEVVASESEVLITVVKHSRDQLAAAVQGIVAGVPFVDCLTTMVRVLTSTSSMLA